MWTGLPEQLTTGELLLAGIGEMQMLRARIERMEARMEQDEGDRERVVAAYIQQEVHLQAWRQWKRMDRRRMRREGMSEAEIREAEERRDGAMAPSGLEYEPSESEEAEESEEEEVVGKGKGRAKQ